jgi:hypothetical protein
MFLVFLCIFHETFYFFSEKNERKINFIFQRPLNQHKKNENIYISINGGEGMKATQNNNTVQGLI